MKFIPHAGTAYADCAGNHHREMNTGKNSAPDTGVFAGVKPSNTMVHLREIPAR